MKIKLSSIQLLDARRFNAWYRRYIRTFNIFSKWLARNNYLTSMGRGVGLAHCSRDTSITIPCVDPKPISVYRIDRTIISTWGNIGLVLCCTTHTISKRRKKVRKCPFENNLVVPLIYPLVLGRKRGERQPPRIDVMLSTVGIIYPGYQKMRELLRSVNQVKNIRTYDFYNSLPLFVKGKFLYVKEVANEEETRL